MRVIIISISIMFFSFSLISQDSLTLETLKEISYEFTIEKGEMAGLGADFIKEEIATAQFTMIGEYHGSKNISIFTNALIPNLNVAGYKTLVLEVGPITGNFLNNLPSKDENVISELKKHNKKYEFIDIDGEVETAIPFFDGVEDAMFLGEAKELNWDIIGIDQEYCNGLIMLSDMMYENLDDSAKAKQESLYKATIDTLKRMYTEWDKNGTPIDAAVKNSSHMKGFLRSMNQNLENKEIITAWEKSMNIYNLHTQRKWYENNATRVRYMKEMLKTGLESNEFDVSKDKLLLKMGGYHVSKGFSPLSLFEVGSTLNELAEYNGNTTVNIGFINRYELEDGKITDALLSTNNYYNKNKNFLALGQTEDWVIIDLRPIKKGFYYYPQKYSLSSGEENMVQRYDLLVVVPTDSSGTPNY